MVSRTCDDAGQGQAARKAHVRFAQKATELLRGIETTRWANRRPEQVQQLA
jgi:hypothetical protein